MVSGNRGEFVAARVLPQVINILMDLRHFPAWVHKGCKKSPWAVGCLEAQGNGGRTQWVDPASVSEGLQTVDDSIRIKFNSSPWWVLSPSHMSDTTGRWAEMGLDKTWIRVRPCLKECFPHNVHSELCHVVYNMTRKKREDSSGWIKMERLYRHNTSEG